MTVKIVKRGNIIYLSIYHNVIRTLKPIGRLR